jgi:hypothetical protein
MTKKTRLALQTHLLGVISNPYIQWENDSDFDVPDLDTPYYKVDLMTAQSTNATINDMESIGAGIFQVMVLFPSNKGTTPMDDKVDEIIAHFQGQKLIYGNTKVKILTPPYFTKLDNTADRFIGAISIDYTTNKI